VSLRRAIKVVSDVLETIVCCLLDAKDSCDLVKARRLARSCGGFVDFRRVRYTL